MVLPPRLTPEAIEAFLDCSWLSGEGCTRMMGLISQGVESALRSSTITPPLDAEVSSRDLVGMMASMLRETESSLATDDDLKMELITLLSSHRFSEALRSSVQHAFRQLVRHIYDALPPPPLSLSPVGSPEGGGSAALSGKGGMSRSMSHLFGSVPSGGVKMGEVTGGAGVRRPLARMLKPTQGAADLLLVPGNVRGLTKGISELAGVMALSAEAFAGPCSSAGIF